MTIELFGYLSGLVMLASFAPYIRDIFLLKTKPERMSWFIWAMLGLIACFSQFTKGASYSLIMTGVQALGDLSIFILAIKYGLGGFLKRDKAALVGMILGLFLWYLTNEAALALFIVIIIDGAGVVLTVMKTYKSPKTETVSTWVLTSLAGFLGCLAVGKFSMILLVFPFYICLSGAAVLIAIELGSRRKSL